MDVLNIREIRKIRCILEKKQNHPVNFHFKLEVQRPARHLWLERDSRILLVHSCVIYTSHSLLFFTLTVFR